MPNQDVELKLGEATQKSDSLVDLAGFLEARLIQLESATGRPTTQEVQQVLLAPNLKIAVNADVPIKISGVNKKTQALESVASKLESRMFALESAVPGAVATPGVTTSRSSVVSCFDSCFGKAKAPTVKSATPVVAARALVVPEAPQVNIDELIQKERLQAAATLSQHKEAHALELANHTQSYTRELAQLKLQLEQTTALHAQAEAKLSDHIVVIQQHESRHAGYNEKVAGYEAQLQSTASQIAREQAEAAAHQQQALAHQQKIIELEAKLAAQAAEVQQHAEASQTHQASVLTIQQKLQEHQDGHARLSEEKAKLLDGHARLSEEKAKLLQALQEHVAKEDDKRAKDEEAKKLLAQERSGYAEQIKLLQEKLVEYESREPPVPMTPSESQDRMMIPTLVATMESSVPTVVATTVDKPLYTPKSSAKGERVLISPPKYAGSEPPSPLKLIYGRTSPPRAVLEPNSPGPYTLKLSGVEPNSPYTLQLAAAQLVSEMSPRPGTKLSYAQRPMSPNASTTSLGTSVKYPLLGSSVSLPHYVTGRASPVVGRGSSPLTTATVQVTASSPSLRAAAYPFVAVAGSPMRGSSPSPKYPQMASPLSSQASIAAAAPIAGTQPSGGAPVSQASSVIAAPSSGPASPGGAGSGTVPLGGQLGASVQSLPVTSAPPGTQVAGTPVPTNSYKSYLMMKPAYTSAPSDPPSTEKTTVTL